MSGRQRWEVYRGTRVAEGWARRIREAQQLEEIDVGGHPVRRIPFGEERTFRAESLSCHDCAATPGDLHVPACDVEECPVCHGQLLTCECEVVGWELDDWPPPPPDDHPGPPEAA